MSASKDETPRITAKYLDHFQNQTVRIVGKVTQLRGDTATIESSGPVILHLTRENHLQLDHAIEVIGKVKPDLSVSILLATDFGTNFDFAAMEAVVDATHRYKEIFYSDNSY